jgi:hypothetical protein
MMFQFQINFVDLQQKGGGAVGHHMAPISSRGTVP